MTKHTPGPWNALIDWTTATWPGHLVKADNLIQSPICAVPRSGNGNSVGDAHLIAAAPELLDALKAILQAAQRMNGEPLPCYTHEWDKVHAAIAKAEGRS